MCAFGGGPEDEKGIRESEGLLRNLIDAEKAKGLTLESKQVRNRIVHASLERLKKSKPPAFFTPEAAELVTVGNLEDNFEWVGEGDWIVEAIVEQLRPKRELFARIERARKPGSIVSSNTSGLPIALAICRR